MKEVSFLAIEAEAGEGHRRADEAVAEGVVAPGGAEVLGRGLDRGLDRRRIGDPLAGRAARPARPRAGRPGWCRRRRSTRSRRSGRSRPRCRGRRSAAGCRPAGRRGAGRRRCRRGRCRRRGPRRRARSRSSSRARGCLRPSMAPTAITLGRVAGKLTVPSPSLPAAATTVMPRGHRAVDRASRSARWCRSPPRLRLMTLTSLFVGREVDALGDGEVVAEALVVQDLHRHERGAEGEAGDARRRCWWPPRSSRRRGCRGSCRRWHGSRC